MTALAPYAGAAGRVLLAFMYVFSGVGKIFAYSGTAGYMAAFGVPGALLPLVIIVEIVAGVMIAIGYQTRLAALALAGFTLVAALIFHNNLADQMQMILFLKNLSLTGAFLFLFANGPGELALDTRKQGLKLSAAS